MVKQLLIILMAILLLFSGCAHCDPWTKDEKILLGIALTAQAVDTAQTFTFLEKQGDGLVEKNPLITTNNGLVSLKLLAAAIIGAATHFLPHKARKTALTIWAAIGAGTVYWNYKQGVRIGSDAKR